MSEQQTATIQLPPLVKPPRRIHRGNKPNRLSPYSQAVLLQDICIEAARKPEQTPAALAQLAKVWNDLEERKRLLRLPRAQSLARASNGHRAGKPERAPLNEAIAATEQPSESPAPKPPVAESTRPTTGEGKPADQDKDAPEIS